MASWKNHVRLFNTVLLIGMTYGSETWSPSKQRKTCRWWRRKRWSGQCLVESFRDEIENQTPRQMSGVKDIAVTTRESKICQTGDIACFADNGGRCASPNISAEMKKVTRPTSKGARTWKSWRVTTKGKRLNIENLGVVAHLNIENLGVVSLLNKRDLHIETWVI